jgi:hypothetical protein
MLASAILLHNDVEYVIPRYLYGEQHFLTHSCCQSNDGILYMCLPSSSLILTNNLPNSLQVDFFYPVDDSFFISVFGPKESRSKISQLFSLLGLYSKKTYPTAKRKNEI